MIYPVPRKLERLVDEVDGWLELRCPERALPLVDALLAEPSARACGLSLRIRAYARMAAFENALADLGVDRRHRAARNKMKIVVVVECEPHQDYPGDIYSSNHF